MSGKHILSLANETLYEIIEYLPKTTQEKLMRVCSRFHELTTSTLYRSNHISSGRQGRLFFLSITNTFPITRFYASAVIHLIIECAVDREVFLTFPIMAKGLLAAQRLQILDIRNLRTHAQHLFRILDGIDGFRDGAIGVKTLNAVKTFQSPNVSESSHSISLWNFLPCLSTLCIDADLKLLRLASHRPITEIRIQVILEESHINDLLDILVTNQASARITSLSLRLSDEIQTLPLLHILSDHFPKLQIFEIDQLGLVTQVSVILRQPNPYRHML